MRRTSAWAVFLLALLVLGFGFLTPLGLVIRNGFISPDGRFTWAYLLGVFRNPVYLEGFGNSLRLALGTTLLATCIALPLAWLANRFTFPGKKCVSALLLVPMILPPFVGAIGFQQIFGQYGVLNALLGLQVDWLGRGRWVGVILLQALALYPVLYLNLAAALANVDHAMEEAAENLGATGWTKFRRITLPLMMPGFFAGGTIVFIWSFTELGTPLIMNYTRCASVQVYDALKEIGGNPFPFALVFVMLSVSVLLYALSKALFGGRAYAMAGKAATVFQETRATGWRGLAVLAPFLLVISLALLPHWGVLLTSFSPPGAWYRTVLPEAFTFANYGEALGHSMTVSSIRNSLVFSLLAVAFNLTFGIAIAFVVVRSTLRLRGLLDGLAMMPLAVPGLVMASGLLALSAWLSNTAAVRAYPVVGQWLDVKSNPTVFLVLAYGIRRLPYMVRAAVAGLQQTSAGLEEAAANLGAPPLTSLRRITLPLITANLIAGALLAFAFSMLEVSDSLMLAQREDFYPITKTIYELFQLLGTGKYLAAALGVWAMVFLAVTLVGSSLLLGKKLGALFRV
ncbi:MAG: iron ABC transporter permease [Candidatus Marinimicrobia bacterium]|nr:iron ABC transporter permease [Candidatus Neomarinimicrobiota bacterium]